MTSSAERAVFAIPPLPARQAEQANIQGGKTTRRPLYGYNECMFPDTLRYSERRAVASVLGHAGAPRRSKFDLGVILQRSVEQLDEGEALHWVDLGPGMGFAQQEILELKRLFPTSWARHVEMTGVDLLEYPVGLGFLRQFYGDKQKGDKPPLGFERPRFIQADAAEVVLPKPAGIITSVFSIHYWHTPLEGLANAYNQLLPNGLLIVAANASYDWTRGVRYASHPTQSPIDDIKRELIGAGVRYTGVSAPTPSELYEGEPPGKHYYSLLFRRLPGTSMKVNAYPAEITCYPEHTERCDYKIVSYQQIDERKPIVELTQSV